VGGTPLYLQSVLAVVFGDVVGDMEDELRKACWTCERRLGVVGLLDARPFLTKRPAAWRTARSCAEEGLRMVGKELGHVEVGETGGETGFGGDCCAGKGGRAIFGGGTGGAAKDKGTDMRAARGLYTGCVKVMPRCFASSGRQRGDAIDQRALLSKERPRFTLSSKEMERVWAGFVGLLTVSELLSVVVCLAGDSKIGLKSAREIDI
jgi:hypothetical protein